MTYDQWKDAVYCLLRDWGWDTRRIFYGIKAVGGCQEAFDRGDTPHAYADKVDRTAPLNLLPEEIARHGNF